MRRSRSERTAEHPALLLVGFIRPREEAGRLTAEMNA
ncbi:hypothetical protein FHT71_002716 [Rhizobium sp. BK060]|nr:hypothetical protein [Rhizobium sp. BK060]